MAILCFIFNNFSYWWVGLYSRFYYFFVAFVIGWLKKKAVRVHSFLGHILVDSQCSILVEWMVFGWVGWYVGFSVFIHLFNVFTLCGLIVVLREVTPSYIDAYTCAQDLWGALPSYILHTRAFGTNLVGGGYLPCKKEYKVMLFLKFSPLTPPPPPSGGCRVVCDNVEVVIVLDDLFWLGCKCVFYRWNF